MHEIKEEEIKKMLVSFRNNTGVTNSSVFTDDGFLIALDQENPELDTDKEQAIGAILSNTITLAHAGLTVFKEKNDVKQLSIQAGDQIDKDGFSLILQKITNSINLSSLFLNSKNLGVIHFELNQLTRRLKEYFEKRELSSDTQGIEATH